MTKLRLLDLFCCAGGSAMGYHRAGFEVVGVDIKPQPRYPFLFIQGDALEFVARNGKHFDAIHASPPCQAYSRAMRHLASPKAQLIEPLRALLQSFVGPTIIENVVGAPLIDPVTICGTAFGMPIYRHRLFECSWPAQGTTCDHTRPCMNPHNAQNRRAMGSHAEAQWRAAMGVTWMSKAEAREAIPPAYTEYLGTQLFAHLQQRMAA